MADNTTLNTGSGGDTIRTLEDGSSIKYPVGIVAYATTVGTPDVISIPTAAALADNTATPTTLLSGACLMVYDGSTWDMGRGDATDGLLVNLGGNNDVTLATLPDTAAGDLAAIRASVGGTLAVGSHAVTNAGTFAVQESGAALTALQLIDDAIYTSGSGTPSKGALVLGSDGTNPKVVATDVNGCVKVVNSTAANLYTASVLYVASEGFVSNSVGVYTRPMSGQTWPVSNAGTFAVQAAQSGTWTVQPGNTANTTAWLVTGTGGTFPATQSGTWNVGTVTTLSQFAGNAIDLGSGTTGAGTLRVTVASDSTGVLSVDDNGGSLTVDVPAVATGGATPGKLVSAASTNATSVKASAGTLYSLTAMTTDATPVYLKLYDKASAPTVGTDTPVQVFMLPGSATGGGCVVPIPVCGIAFSNGIALALTTGAADSDTGAVAANEVVVSYSYK